MVESLDSSPVIGGWPGLRPGLIAPRERNPVYLEQLLDLYWQELLVLLRHIRQDKPPKPSRLRRLQVLVHYNIPRVLFLGQRHLQEFEQPLAGSVVIASVILNHLYANATLEPAGPRVRPYPYWTVKQAACEQCSQCQGPWFWERVPAGERVYPSTQQISGYRDRKRVMLYGCPTCMAPEAPAQVPGIQRELVLKSFACRRCRKPNQIIAWEAIALGGSPTNALITCDAVDARERRVVVNCRGCGGGEAVIYPEVCSLPTTEAVVTSIGWFSLGAPVRA